MTEGLSAVTRTGIVCVSLSLFYIEKLTKEAMEQVGRASEKASRVINRQLFRDEAIWWLRLALTAIPTILVLLLWACVGLGI